LRPHFTYSDPGETALDPGKTAFGECFFASDPAFGQKSENRDEIGRKFLYNAREF
jgi:hypothetical protein